MIGVQSIYYVERIFDLKPFGLVKEEFEFLHSMWVSKGTNSLGGEAIFKCGDLTNQEMFGYVFATMLGFSVPRFKGIWFEGDFDRSNGILRQANSVGLLIEKIIPAQEICLYGAVQRDKKIAAQNLLLRLFLGGGEPPQILISGSKMLIYDLEWIGPQMLMGDTAEVLKGNAGKYLDSSDDQLGRVLELASKHDILDAFIVTLQEFQSTVGVSGFSQLFVTGHPQSEIMSKVFFKAVANRYEKCLKKIRLNKTNS